MRTNLLIVLLVMSALFNIFFAVGYVRSRAQAEVAAATDPEAIQVARELNLSESQRAAFEELRSNMRAEQAVLAESLALLRQELTQELAQQQPDLERVRSIFARETELLGQRREAETRHFSAFVGLLNPDQTRILAERFGQRGPWRGHGPGGPGPGSGPGGKGDDPGRDSDRPSGPDGRWRWLLERFDTDGDGQLSEQERAAAHQAMEQGRQRERERREALFDRFDADDDGKLDRDELGAWMRWNFEQGRNRPPRPSGPRPPDGPPRDSTDSPPAKPAESAPAVHPPL